MLFSTNQSRALSGSRGHLDQLWIVPKVDTVVPGISCCRPNTILWMFKVESCQEQMVQEGSKTSPLMAPMHMIP